MRTRRAGGSGILGVDVWSHMDKPVQPAAASDQDDPTNSELHQLAHFRRMIELDDSTAPPADLGKPGLPPIAPPSS